MESKKKNERKKPHVQIDEVDVEKTSEKENENLKNKSL